MISGDHYLPLTSKDWESAHGRTQKPSLRLSVSPYEKADPEILCTSSRGRPTTDPKFRISVAAFGTLLPFINDEVVALSS